MLACPACGHSQNETALALSTICRSCGEYFKVANGVAVANKPAPLNPFGNKAAPTPAAVEIEPPVAPEPTQPNRIEQPSEPPADLICSKREPIGNGRTRNSEREIECLDCGLPHTARGNEATSHCPHCESKVPLKDFVIAEDWSFRIKTQGDVMIESSGKVRGAAVQCYNLTIRGAFDGAADCTGELHIFSSATISGRLRCKRLLVEKRADLTLSHPVAADEIVVKGAIFGGIECSGRVVLHEDAVVEGDIKAASLSIHPGAQHSGLVNMTGLSITRQVSDAMSEED